MDVRNFIYLYIFAGNWSFKKQIILGKGDR